MDDPFDRDLVAEPPKAIISADYERFFDAYVEIATATLDLNLPKRPKGAARIQLFDAFRTNFRELFLNHRIAVPKPDDLPELAAELMAEFQPAVAFLTAGRELVVPEAYLEPPRRVRNETSEANADSAVPCFVYELIAVIDKSISPYGLSLEERKKTCEDTAWALAMWFDDDSIDAAELVGQEIAFVFCYADDRDSLVLIPIVAAHHESVHGNLDEYFSR